MKYFAIHDDAANVRRIVGHSSGPEPEVEGMVVTEVPSLNHRIRQTGDGYEPYLPPPEPPGVSMDQLRAQKRIAALERRQLRPLRELALDPNDADAKARLAALDGEIATLRLQLS